MPKIRWRREKQEAVENMDNLPHKISTKEPKKLRDALDRFFRRKNILGIGMTQDPDGDGVWIRKRK